MAAGTVTGMTTYSPEMDGEADPGEVVWGWVPYEDDASQGKDRPVLVLARTGSTLTCLYLTSKDHDRDAEDEARWGRYWMDVGTGPWDAQGRESEIRLDRVLAPGGHRRPPGGCGARPGRVRPGAGRGPGALDLRTGLSTANPATRGAPGATVGG